MSDQPLLTLAISCTVLFDMSESDRIFHEEGIERYRDHQLKHENDILKPGAAFALVKKLLDLNQKEHLVEVVLLSRNSANTGLRVFNSIEHHKLDIRKAAFTSGKNPYRYLHAFGAQLFLSTKKNDVQSALDSGCAAGMLMTPHAHGNKSNLLKIAFDGDCVLFSDEAEKINCEKGLEAFSKNEKQSAKVPLKSGPFKPFLDALYAVQKHFPENECPIKTALVTAREAPAHERVIRTLRSWNIRLDEAIFLGGMSKTEFLKSFGADIFFDDRQSHCKAANEHLAAAHVPHGITNADSNS